MKLKLRMSTYNDVELVIQNNLTTKDNLIHLSIFIEG
jgi:hypothetical protein